LKEVKGKIKRVQRLHKSQDFKEIVMELVDEWEYSTVEGFFLQDYQETDAASFDFVRPFEPVQRGDSFIFKSSR
jgi:hypothetical protein